MRTRGEVQRFESAEAASRAGAERFLEHARAAVEARGRFVAALSGGETPRAMYSLLATEPFRSSIPWSQVHLFWGDDRCVPPHHPRSNYRMAWEAFLRAVPLPDGNIHRIHGELRGPEAASAYARGLMAFFGELPRFDVVHLGVGPDAHTASLFPFSPLLAELGGVACAARQPGTGEPRVTLTLPVLNAGRIVEFLVLGAERGAVVQRVLQGALDPRHYPAQAIRPTAAPAVWLLDPGAAARLATRASPSADQSGV